MTTTTKAQAIKVQELSTALQPLLSGQDPDVIGATLADLVAILLAGHMVLDDDGEVDRGKTDEFREGLIALHADTVRELVLLNEKSILARHKAQAN